MTDNRPPVSWIVKAALTALTLGASYVILYSNAHNDERYVRIENYRVDRARDVEAYQNDRNRDQELRRVVDSQINTRFDSQEKKLEEISGDLKTLLKESRR